MLSVLPKFESSAERNGCRQTNAFQYIYVSHTRSRSEYKAAGKSEERENSIRTIVIPFFRITGPYQLFTLNKHTHTLALTLSQTPSHTHLGRANQTLAMMMTMAIYSIHFSSHYLLKVTHCSPLSHTQSVSIKWNDKHKYRPKKKSAVYLVGVMCDFFLLFISWNAMANVYAYYIPLFRHVRYIAWNFQ